MDLKQLFYLVGNLVGMMQLPREMVIQSSQICRGGGSGRNAISPKRVRGKEPSRLFSPVRGSIRTHRRHAQWELFCLLMILPKYTFCASQHFITQLPYSGA